MKGASRFLSIVVCLAATAAISSGSPLYVSTTSPANGPGTAWSNAYHTIQAAINAATTSNWVIVSNGVYSAGSTTVNSMRNRVSLQKAIEVTSLNGPSVTTIYGTGPRGASAVRCLYITAGTVSGFTLRNGHTDGYSNNNTYQHSGGGVFMRGGTLTNCVVTQCQADYFAGGILCYQGGRVVNSHITDNTCYNQLGGGVWIYGSGTLDNCVVVGNRTYKDWGGGVYCRSGGRINNCTITGNTAGRSGGGIYSWDSARIRNTIVYYNTGGNIGDQGSGMVYENNCSTWYTGSNGVREEPLFVNRGARNFRLLHASPCINAGNNTYAPLPDDLDGNPRVFDATVDIGAYEFQFPQAIVTVTNPNVTVYGDVPTYTIGGTCTTGTVGALTWTNALAADGGTIPAQTNWSFVTDLGVGENAITVSGTNAYGHTSSDNVSIRREYPWPDMRITTSDTNVYGTVTEFTIEGTNDEWVAGMMVWTNRHSGIGGTHPAPAGRDRSWQISGIPLNTGDNYIDVTATNAIGYDTQDSVRITRTYYPGDLMITTPDGTVSSTVTQATIEGTNNAWIVGTMWWTNYANSTGGELSAPAGPDYSWSIPVTLAYGINEIEVGGTDILERVSSDDVTIRRIVPEHTGDSPIHYVSTNGAAKWPYKSWSNAARVIQNAIDAAGSGDTVRVNDGTYVTGGGTVSNMDCRVVLTQGITVESVNGPEHTTIAAEQEEGPGAPPRGPAGLPQELMIGPDAVRCAYLENGTTLAGFTLTRGATHSGGHWAYEDSGGGAFLDRGGLLTNCVMRDCDADYYGGGVFCYYGGTVRNCTLEDNYAGDGGGGIYCLYTGTVSDCIFNWNEGSYYGGGAFLYEGGSVADSTFVGNESEYGGGVYCEYGGSVTNCSMVNGYASYYGGGVYLYDGGTVDRCVIRNNYASDYGGGAYIEDQGTIRNCLLAANEAYYYAGGVYLDGGGDVVNCTLARNWCDDYSGGGVYFDDGGTVANSIVWGNWAYDSGDNWEVSGTGTLVNCCTTPEEGLNCVTNSPQFLNPVGGDYRLRYGSPCLDAGSNALAMGSLDVVSLPRISGARIDIGAYEYPLDAFVNITTPDADVAGPVGHYDIAGAGSASLVGQMWWSNLRNDGTDTFAASVTWEVLQVPLGLGTNVIIVYGTNASGVVGYDAMTLSRESLHTGDSPIHYAWPDSPNETWPFASWETAAHVLQDAVEAAMSNETVMATNGVYDAGGTIPGGYALKSRVCVRKPLTVTSVNGPEHTVIVGQGPVGDTAVRCLFMEDGATVSGFTLTNGHTVVEGESEDEDGGGVLMDSGTTLSNCVVVGCRTLDDGGGIKYYGGTLVDCVIRGNEADDEGGGIIAYGEGQIERCIIEGNTAGYGGGGVYVSSDVRLRNCLVTGNTASEEGGGVSAYRTVLENCTIAENGCDNSGSGVYGYRTTLEHCIIWGNSPGGPMEVGGSRVSEYYCCRAWEDGPGTITNDPEFVDAPASNYRLQGTSACIDAGDSEEAPDGTDLDGIARVLDGDADGSNVVDIGCYEFIHAGADSDGDGQTDGDEVIADTDLGDAGSLFQIRDITRNSPATVWFQSSAGRQYTLVFCTDLVGRVWNSVPGAVDIMGSGGMDSLTDPDAPSPCYYRLRVSQP